MSDYLYVPGSGIQVPGIEAILEYGDAATAKNDFIPGALRINDQSTPTRVRIKGIDGLQDDPDGRDTRQPLADRHGEDAGDMVYGGRTVGLTGAVEAGNVRAMRDKWARFRSTFGTAEKNLLIHTPDDVPVFTNLVANPSFKVNADNWSVVSTATVTGPTGGNSAAPNLVGQIQYVTAGANTSLIYSNRSAYGGEDIYVFARIRISTVTSGTLSSIGVGVVYETPSASVSSASFTSQSSPVTGTWYTLAARIPAASLFNPDVARVGVSIQTVTAGAANFVLQIDEAMIVLLGASDPTPAGYFDGDSSGFGWTGAPYASPSVGPLYAVNKVSDPELVDLDVNFNSQSWVAETNTGITINNSGVQSKIGAGVVGNSIHVSQQKDLNTTSRTMAILNKDLNQPLNAAGTMVAHAGRTYRFTVTVTNDAKPATGSLVASLRWLLASNVNTAEVDGTALSGTAGTITVTATAPTNTVGVMPLIRVVGTTTSGALWSCYLTDPCLIDVTDYDPGDFYGVGDQADEVNASVASLARSRARRRIPRPFVLDGVRKTSDAKAPEQQRNTRYTRDFTMSLRASDPRIYVFDKRAAGLRLSSSSSLVSRQMPTDFSLESGSLGVPTGWTYEGNFVTHPGTGSAYNWSQEMTLPTVSFAKLLNGGVGIKTWNSSGVQGSNQPASDLSARMYRSTEGYTYSLPRVIMGCSPTSVGTNANGYDDGSMNVLFNGTTPYWNEATILLKRVSSTTWLELRWTSASNAYSQSRGGSNGAVSSFELWCSHNAAGTLTTSKLSSWDYTSYDSTNGKLPFVPSRDQMYLVAYMSNNGSFDVVNWELWRGFPSLISTVNRVESGSYNLSSSLSTLVGSGVSGSTGMALSMKKTNSTANWNTLSARPPFVHYWESYADQFPPQSVCCPVIGSIDTPQQIVLAGITNPIVTVETPAFDELPLQTSVAKLSGAISATVPITIDFDESGSITDSTGANRYDMLLSGSALRRFRPGPNYLTVRATSWLSTVPNHAYATWRDALR